MSNDKSNQNFITIQIPLPPNLAELVGELKTAAAGIKSDLAEIKNLRETPLSYSEPEAAELLGISLITLERIRRSGKIKFSRVATKSRYLPEHLQDYLKSQEIGGGGKRR